MMGKLGAFLAYVTLLAPLVFGILSIIKARKPVKRSQNHGKRPR